MKRDGYAGTHRVLQLRVLLLRVDQVEDDVERARQDEREEEAKAGQVCVALGAATRSGKDTLAFAAVI